MILEPDHIRKARLLALKIVNEYQEYVAVTGPAHTATIVREHHAQLCADRHGYLRERRRDIVNVARIRLEEISGTYRWWRVLSVGWWIVRGFTVWSMLSAVALTSTRPHRFGLFCIRELLTELSCEAS